MSVAHSPTRSGPVVGRSDSQPNLASRSSMDVMMSDRVTLRNKRKQTSDNEIILEELTEMRKQMSQMMIMMTTLNTNQKDCMDSISKDIITIKENLSTLTTTTETLLSDQNLMKLDIENLSNKNITTEKKLEALESEVVLLKIASQSSSPTSDTIMAELGDRQQRSRNVIVVGVPESTSKEPDTRMNSDKSKVIEIIKSIDDECPEPVRIFRLGRYNPKKIRHIKVCFKSQDSAKDVLRKRNVINDDTVKIFSDQTPNQKEYLKTLKDELKRRTESGKNNLTIKYKNGIPKIIESQIKKKPQGLV